MPEITLPDGNRKIFKKAISVAEVAKSIGPGLASAMVAGRVDGKLVDAAFEIDADATVEIITQNDEDGLDIIRHSTAHLLAQAVKRLFPKAQVTIGPVIENGFYYDFFYEAGFSTNDMDAIEAMMQKIIAENLTVRRRQMARESAVDFFKQQGEYYKAEIIQSIAADEEISLYEQGEFIDLCRGPHVPATGKLRAFKLTKVAGAYWRGDSQNPMLQRIYGTAWARDKDLKIYLERLALAKKRDHRRINKIQNLFHIAEDAPGMIFWHERGWVLYRQVVGYLRTVLEQNGYREIHTPEIIDRGLWEKSGHWDKFSAAMFITRSENRDYAVKPMNCPAHVLIYNQGLKSYRDLPLRLAEFGSCHRNEASGTLHGLMRVRNFVQDDAHIFCAESQVQSEVSKFIDLTFAVYKKFGFEDISIKFSTRPDARVGSDAVWDKAEAALQKALDAKGLDWKLQAGEGAFYGPKIEFVLKDCLAREWQCGTLQVDFSMPERLGATFIDKDNTKKTPVMIHRAIVGSIERFVGILIEHYEGAFPAWLAPVQAAVLTISKVHDDYARTVVNALRQNGLRVISDLRNEKIGFKIREHSMQRYPFILVVGDKESQNRQISVRKRGGKDLGVLTVDEFTQLVHQD